MLDIEKKIVHTSVRGIGNMEFYILNIGKESWLKEIHKFLTQNETCFTVCAIQKPELKNSLFLQRAIQAFVNHIQAGADQQQSNQITNHFRHWLYRQNGSLKKIINAESGNPSESRQEFRDSIQEELNRRFRTWQQGGN